MSSPPPNDARSGETPIRDAACLILIDRSASAPRLLMGRRLPTQIFLPNKWVFPGGRVDDDDRAFAAILGAAANIERPADIIDSVKTLESLHLPFALAAIRETLEETGLFVGRHCGPKPDRTLPPAWQAIAAMGLAPQLDRFRPLARAITPPGFPRRFDTWFFVADWHAETPAVAAPDGELSALTWFTLGEVVALDLPLITRMIVDDVASHLATDKTTEIPFYFQDKTEYRRVLVGTADGDGLP